MSAPDTSLEREQRRHAPSLLGIGLSMGAGLIMGATIMYVSIERSDTPEAPEAAPSDATGLPVE
ncbi:MAG: hypothetical protein ACU0CY_05690 [Maritimibacter harenae]|jgi:hypothetical protein|uniref:Uncharacterized protein n=1 Tax=Maritimibacter harenae TaxID=2606218 RepID=A0A845M3D1_9RHOB|nr:hypothetical protein [Maritimibacter harenae]MZR12878.1 hypothetical protein [Maritimibacter harenae]